MKSCQNCGRGVVLGKSGVHQYGGRWHRRGPKTPRVWKANLHRAKIKVNGNFKTMTLCTKCLRKFRKKTQETREPTSQILISQSTP